MGTSFLTAWRPELEAVLPYISPESIERLKRRADEEATIKEWLSRHPVTRLTSEDMTIGAYDRFARTSVGGMVGWLRRQGVGCEWLTRNFYQVRGRRMHWKSVLTMVNNMRRQQKLPLFKVGGFEFSRTTHR